MGGYVRRSVVVAVVCRSVSVVVCVSCPTAVGCCGGAAVDTSPLVRGNVRNIPVGFQTGWSQTVTCLS